MQAFKLRVNPAFSRDGIVKSFVPYTQLLTFQPVFPYTIRAASHPLHAQHAIFRIMKSDTQVISRTRLLVTVFELRKFTGFENPFYPETAVSIYRLNNISIVFFVMPELRQLQVTACPCGSFTECDFVFSIEHVFQVSGGCVETKHNAIALQRKNISFISYRKGAGV